MFSYKYRHGCLWWIFFGWWLWCFSLPFAILNSLFHPERKNRIQYNRGKQQINKIRRRYAQQEKWKNQNKTSGIEETDGMVGYEFEYWCAALLNNNGFKHITVTPRSGDQGVDIIANIGGEKYAIQCKRYNNKVSNKALQEVIAGCAYYNCDIAVVMTNCYYTQSAYDLAEKTHVILWDRDDLIKMCANAKLNKSIDKTLMNNYNSRI